MTWPSRKTFNSVDLGHGMQVNLPKDWMHTNPQIPYFPWTKSLVNRWGKILRIDQLNCGAPFEVYIETLGPALLRLFASLAPPGQVDILKAKLNHSYNCGFKKLFREAEKYLPNAAPAATKFLFRTTGGLFAANWYFFVADALTEFVFDWTSAIYQRAPCLPNPRGGPCQVSDMFEPIFIPTAWFTVNYNIIDNDPSHWCHSGLPAAPIAPGFAGGFQAWASIEFANAGSGLNSGELQLIDGLGNVFASGSTGNIVPGQVASAVAEGSFNAQGAGQASVRAQVRMTSGGQLNTRAGFMTCQNII